MGDPSQHLGPRRLDLFAQRARARDDERKGHPGPAPRRDGVERPLGLHEAADEQDAGRTAGRAASRGGRQIDERRDDVDARGREPGRHELAAHVLGEHETVASRIVARRARVRAMISS